MTPLARVPMTRRDRMIDATSCVAIQGAARITWVGRGSPRWLDRAGVRQGAPRACDAFGGDLLDCTLSVGSKVSPSGNMAW